MQKKRKPPVKTYTVTLDGDLEGFVVTLKGLSTRDLIRINTGDVPTSEVLELVIDKVVEHNFDIDDLHDLDAWIAMRIFTAWSEHASEMAVPPESATS